MVAAYSTFANQGVYIKPQVIDRIEDKNGVVIIQTVTETQDVLNKDVAFAVIKLLEGVTESGSGVRLRTTWKGNGYNRCNRLSPIHLKILLPVKQELHKTSPMGGLWVWCPTLSQGFG